MEIDKMRFGHGYGRWLGGEFGGGMRGEHRHGGGGHHERGGGRRRMFDGGELRLVLLAMIEEQPRHGYDLIRAIEEQTGGAYAPSPGVVYPTLTLLDEMGQIVEVKEDGARKRFAITDAGRAFLEERRGEIEGLLQRLARIGQEESRHGAGPVKRAMTSLHMALRDALAATHDRDMLHEVTAILDEATRKIERLER
jgi:DNA-binding PadR family transcriptional regulator